MSLPFTINQVVELLGLERDPKTQKGAVAYNVRCPFCGDKQYHMNINVAKNTYNCVRCTGEHTGGGALDLYGRAALGVELIPGRTKDGGNGSAICESLMKALGTARAQGGAKVPIKEQPPQETVVRNLRAVDSALHEAYQALLEFPELKLTKAHLENLRNRGLDDPSIRRNQYRSVQPDFTWVYDHKTDIRQYKDLGLEKECRQYDVLRKAEYKWRVACWLVGQFVARKVPNLVGVPGFFRLKGQWFFKLDVGMLIPTRNAKGEIVGLQTRKDHGDIRYLTVSSKGLPEGVTEGITRVHFPLGNAPVESAARVIFTEGPLKADIAVHLMDYPVFVFALQGVNNRGELPGIFKALRNHGINSIWNGFDMDKTINPHVASAGMVIRSLAQADGLSMKMMMWDDEYGRKKYLELYALCLTHHIPVDLEGKNLFVAIRIMADALDANGVQHSMKEINGKQEKDYWNSQTKGLDDYLLSQRKKHQTSAP